MMDFQSLKPRRSWVVSCFPLKLISRKPVRVLMVPFRFQSMGIRASGSPAAPRPSTRISPELAMGVLFEPSQYLLAATRAGVVPSGRFLKLKELCTFAIGAYQRSLYLSLIHISEPTRLLSIS